MIEVPRSPVLTVGIVGVLLLSGCSDEPEASGAQSSSVTDSAGVRIVETPDPGDGAAPVRVAPEPVYRIGWDGSERVFEDVVGGVLLEEGRAAVVDGGSTQELALLSPDGAVENVWGGVGQGPDEFTSISSIATRGTDTLLVMDVRNGRLSVFDPSGFVGSTPVGSLSVLHLLGAAGERVMLGMPLAMVMGRRYETPFSQVPMVVLDPATGQADTVAHADWDQSIAVGGGNNPFMSGGFITTAGDRFVVGRGDRPELRWYDQEGQLRQVARWQADPVPVPDSLIATWETRIRSSLEGAGLSGPDIQERVDAMKDAMQEPLPFFGIPGSMPSPGGLRADPTGTVWIAEYRPPGQGPPHRYFLVSEEGSWLGSVEVPDGLRILAIGEDRLLAVERSELDEQAVAAYRVER